MDTLSVVGKNMCEAVKNCVAFLCLFWHVWNLCVTMERNISNDVNDDMMNKLYNHIMTVMSFYSSKRSDRVLNK